MAGKKKGGRPSKYSPAVIEAICERLSRGEPLAVICRDEGMPAYGTVRNWMDAMPEVFAAIARARESGEDYLAAECIEIANTPCIGEELELDESGVVVKTKRGDMLGHRKLQIDTRLKLLAKWNPKKWGDKQTIEHDVVGNLADEMKAARERAAKR